MSELVEGSQAVLALGLRARLVKSSRGFLGDLGSISLEGPDVEALVPDVDRAHRGEAAHLAPVLARGLGHRPAPVALVEAEIPPADREARHEPLHVPLEWARMGLVEVVDVEDQPSVGGCEDAEVGEVRIATELNVQIGVRRSTEVGRHDSRRTPVEGES